MEALTLSPHVGPRPRTRSFHDMQRSTKQHSFSQAPVSPYCALKRNEVSRREEGEKTYASCKELPLGLRALVVPPGIKVQDLHESYYGGTTQWPIKLQRRNDAAAGGMETPRGTAGYFGVDEQGLTIEALRFGHTPTFYSVSDSPAYHSGVLSPHAKKGGATPIPRPGHVQHDETGMQIFLTTPKCSPEGMCVTHLFLRGDNIGEAVLYVPPLGSTRPVPPLRQAGRYEDPEENGRVEVKMDHEIDAATGHAQYRIRKPVKAATYLLVVRRKGASSGAQGSPSRRDGSPTSLAAVTFGDAPGKYHLLSPAAQISFEVGGTEYLSVEQYRTVNGYDGMMIPAEKLLECMRAKFMHDTCKAALLATGRRPLRYELPEERRKGALSIQYTQLTNISLEQVRAELRAESSRKKTMSPVRGGTLQISYLSAIGFDQFSKDVKVKGSVAGIQERVLCPLYLASIQNDIESVRRALRTLAHAHPPAVVEAVCGLGSKLGDEKIYKNTGSPLWSAPW